MDISVLLPAFNAERTVEQSVQSVLAQTHEAFELLVVNDCSTDATRAWSRRFGARHGGRMPTMNQAGVYSETLAFLRAAAEAGSVSGRAVIAQMGARPIEDALFGPTTVRRDGRAVHAMYVFRVKPPERSAGPFDAYDLVATIPPAEAFRPMEQGGCLLTR